MPSTFVPLPAFPTVFAYPGVPPLPVPPGGVNLVAPILAAADVAGLSALVGGPQWGIFSQGGAPVLQADSVNSFDYERGYLVSDYPQEQGAFQSYNKVTLRLSTHSAGGVTQRDVELAEAIGHLA